TSDPQLLCQSSTFDIGAAELQAQTVVPFAGATCPTDSCRSTRHLAPDMLEEPSGDQLARHHLGDSTPIPHNKAQVAEPTPRNRDMAYCQEKRRLELVPLPRYSV